jgi:hypothetical protein
MNSSEGDLSSLTVTKYLKSQDAGSLVIPASLSLIPFQVFKCLNVPYFNKLRSLLYNEISYQINPAHLHVHPQIYTLHDELDLDQLSDLKLVGNSYPILKILVSYSTND